MHRSSHRTPIRSDRSVPGRPRPAGVGRLAIRDASDPDHGWLQEHVTGRTLFLVELLYSDHEGGQRAIGLFSLAPGEEHHWLCSMVRHWNLDRPNPR